MEGAQTFDSGKPIPETILCPKAQILKRCQHTDVVEAAVHGLGIADAGGTGPHLTNRGTSEFGSFVTGDTLATGLAAKEVHTQDGLRTNGIRITVHKLIVG